MSKFSQLLSQYIQEKNVRIYSLAEYCGIDRSLMYKIVHGKRTPGSASAVDKIADYLHLTPRRMPRTNRCIFYHSPGK